MVMTERFLAADGLVDDSIDRRLIAGLGRLDSSLRHLDGIARRRAVRAVVERVIRAVILRQVVLRVLELVADVEHRVRRQADDIVERRDRDVVVVLRHHEGLLRVGELDLRGEHVRLGDRADAVLRIDVVEVLLQRVDRLLLDIDEVAALQDVVVVRRRLQADGLLRLLEREVLRIETVACLLDLALDRAIVERHHALCRIRPRVIIGRPHAKRMCIMSRIQRITADAVCTRSPGHGRTHRAARFRERPLGRVDVRQGLADRAVVLECHLHAVVQVELNGVSGESRA